MGRRCGAFALVGFIAFGASALQGQARYAAIVDAKFGGRNGDSTAAMPVYRSIGAALGGTTANGGPRAIVFVRNGRYREKLAIDRERGDYRAYRAHLRRQLVAVRY